VLGRVGKEDEITSAVVFASALVSYEPEQAFRDQAPNRRILITTSDTPIRANQRIKWARSASLTNAPARSTLTSSRNVMLSAFRFL